MVAVSVGLSLVGCDRSDLSQGPRLTLHRTPGGGTTPPPDPDPGTDDCGTPPAPAALKVKINEVMPANESTLEDEKGAFPPWIELYNNSDSEINLGGVFISNDLLNPSLWKVPCIPEARIPPRGFLVIFADGDSSNDKDLHASFKLATSGSLQLVVNKSSDLFFFDASRLGPDESAGRYRDGLAAISKLTRPTPGAANSEPAQAASPAQSPFLRADANSDGRVNVSDMTTILRVLFQGLEGPLCKDRLDSNDDGVVNLADVLFIGQSLYQKGPPIPAPFPAAGTDPTADVLECPAP